MKIAERELYGDMAAWLRERLRGLYPNWEVTTHDTSTVKLSGFLYRIGLQGAFPGSEAFEIEVDITAVMKRGKKAELAFVECKTAPITLKDVGQILGYSRVAFPLLSVILSPTGLSESLNSLLHTYNRVDLLDYGTGRRLKVGTWDGNRKQVDPATVFPPGELG